MCTTVLPKCLTNWLPTKAPMKTPKGKEFSVIVLNADFEIIGETKIPRKEIFL